MAININGLGVQSTLSSNKSDKIQKKEDDVLSSNASTNVDSKETLSDDTVQLSSIAQSLQSKGDGSDSDAVDMDKVEQIKQALASGDYKIDTQKLASNMMSLDSLFA